MAHIEQFGPILVESLVSITKSNEARKKRAEEGLMKLLGRDSKDAHAELEEAATKLKDLHVREAKKRGEDPGAAPAGAAMAEEKDSRSEEPGQAELFEGAVVAQAKKARKAGSKKSPAKAK